MYWFLKYFKRQFPIERYISIQITETKPKNPFFILFTLFSRKRHTGKTKQHKYRMYKFFWPYKNSELIWVRHKKWNNKCNLSSFRDIWKGSNWLSNWLFSDIHYWYSPFHFSISTGHISYQPCHLFSAYFLFRFYKSLVMSHWNDQF